MGRTWLSALLLPIGLGLSALTLVPRPASATQLLTNPGFESWSGGSPTSWSTSGGAPSAETGIVVAGSALRVTGGNSVQVHHSVVAALAGGRYDASVHVAGDSGTQARLLIQFGDDGYSDLGPPHATSWSALTGAYRLLHLSAILAPAATANVSFTIEFALAGAAAVEALADDASLTMASPPEPTPTHESTEPPADPSLTPPSATSETTPGGGATATAKSSPPKTATSPGVPTPAPPGGGGIKLGTPTKVPTLPPTSTPTRPPGQGVPGSVWELVNGGFESALDGKPLHWSKYGGALGLEGAAFEGHYAATLSSDTESTKWIYQTVRVQPGNWYGATAVGRMSIGSGQVSLRLSWYSSEDGSGSMLEQVESNGSSGRAWTPLSVTGQAPEGARSVRVRLVLQPAGHCTAAFDAVQFAAGSAPESPATATPTTLPGDPSPAQAGEEPDRPLAGNATAIAGATAAGRPWPFSDPPAVRISEVLTNPEEPGQDSAYEWVELVNSGNEAVTLAGWTIGDSKEIDPIPPFTLAAGSYVVVAGKSAAMPATVAVLRIPDGEIGAGLNNGGDTIRLVAPDGTVADAISFGSDSSIFDPPPPAPEPGMTIGIRDPSSDPAESNWALTDRPSPGAPNTFPARPAPSGAAPSTAQPGSTVAASGQAFVPQQSGKGMSAIPWMLLGGAAGAGLLGLAGLLRRTMPSIRSRTNRGD